MSITRRGPRRLAVAGVVAGALVLSACSSSSSGGGEGGGSGDPIKIGLAVALTGVNASTTPQMSMEYAIKEINDKGGVNGRKFEFVAEDTGATAATGLAAARKFVQEKVDAVVGFSLTTQNLAVSPVFKAAKMPSFLGTASIANNFEKTGNQYNFIFNVPDDETAKHQVTYATETLGAKRIALLLDSTAFGKGYGELVTPLITAAGGQVVDTQYVNPDANDLSTQVAKNLASKPDLMMVALLGSATATLMYNELRKQAGSNQPELMVAAAVVAQFGKGIPWATATGTYSTYMTQGIYNPPDRAPEAKGFYDATAGGDTPVNDADVEAHDAIIAYASAVDATGGTDPDKIVDYLKSLKDFKGWNGIDTVTGPYTCATTHQCLHAQYMGQAKGDGLVEVKHYTE
jgi:branched-chain amino acid transport system substrate-binding protein